MPKREASDDELAPPPKVAANLPWPKIPEIKTEEEVNADRSNSEYRKIVEVLKTVTSVKSAKPTMIVPNIKDISQVLDGPEIDGRNFSLQNPRNDNQNYTWTIRDKSSPTLLSSAEATIKIPVALMGEKSNSTARRVADKVIEVLKRWTSPLSTGQGQRGLASIVRGCGSLVVHGHARVYVPQAKSKPRRDTETEYLVLVPYIDRTTGKRESITLVATPKTVEAADIPQLPPYVQYINPARDFEVIDKVVDPDGDMHWPPVVPEQLPERDSREAHEKAAMYYHYMAYLFVDTLATEKEIKTVQASVSRSIGAEKKARTGIYRGGPMFTISDEHTKLKITACKAVREDLGTDQVPRVIVKSPNQARGQSVVDTAEARFIETEDLQQALLAFGDATDETNREVRAGEPPSNACDHDDEQKKTCFHTCGKCGELVLCETRQQDWRGTWVCRFCYIRASTDSSRNMVAKILESSLKDQFRNDCARLGLDPDAPAQQKVYDEALHDLQKYIVSSTSYLDQYRSAIVDLSKNQNLEGHTLYSPDLPSVDAVFSFYERDGKLLYHCAGNVAVTAVALNFLKHMQHPAFLSHVAEFSRSEKTAADQVKVLKKVTNSALIRMKVPYKLKTRTKRPFRKLEFQNDLNEWLSDRLAPSRKPAIFSTGRLRILNGRRRKRLSAKDRERLMRVIREIEQRFGVTLPRAADGCPWPGLVEAMPENWCWEEFWALVCDRLDRMRRKCNRHWKTVDTVDTLLLEIVYQACDPAYRDFLGLPLVAWARHPFCISIAHKVHKRQMRSGWRNGAPESLSERDDTLNNILIETQSSNYFKHDFDPSTYPRLLRMIQEVFVPQEFYDPDLATELYADSETEALAEAGVDPEAFEGEAFEDAFL